MSIFPSPRSGRYVVASGVSPWNKECLLLSFSPRSGRYSIQIILRIVSNPMLIQKRLQLLCKTHMPMMFGLPLNILLDRLNARLVHAETGKSALPLEPKRQIKLFFNPPRRITFDFLNKFRNRQGRLDFTQQMNMIGYAVHHQKRTIQMANNSADITMHLFSICVF